MKASEDLPTAVEIHYYEVMDEENPEVMPTPVEIHYYEAMDEENPSPDSKVSCIVPL